MKQPTSERSSFRNSRTAQIVGLLIVFGVGAYFYQGCRPVWQFDNLENRARKVITGDQLQDWATNLIALHRTNAWVSFRISDLGTNFPPQLRDVIALKSGPHVEIYQWEDPAQPPSVRIWWGSGFLGRAGFEMGSTNFIGQGHAWQPGVYFFKNP